MKHSDFTKSESELLKSEKVSSESKQNLIRSKSELEFIKSKYRPAKIKGIRRKRKSKMVQHANANFKNQILKPEG